jgi:peptidylprolyl isomerase
VRPAPPANAKPAPPADAQPAPPAATAPADPPTLEAQRATLEALMQRLRADLPPDAQPSLALSPDAPAAVDLSQAVKLPSGVEYVDVITGIGPEVGPSDLFVAHIASWQPDGKRIGDPTKLASRARVIPGLKSLPTEALREGLSGIRLGSRRLLIVPPDAARKPNPLAGGPAPNALTIVEVVVVNVAYIDPATPKPALDAPSAFDPARLQTTPSGLQYVDLKEGTGDLPLPGQTAVVHYTGWLSDGLKPLGGSVERGEPLTFPLGQGAVIPGWEEGIATMRPGGKRLLIIPPNLGYSAPGAATLRPPRGDAPLDAALTFEVTLYHAL